MNTEIFRDNQYAITTSLDAPIMQHAANIKEIAYAALFKFIKDNNIGKEEAMRKFEDLKKRETELQAEMLSEINKL